MDIILIIGASIIGLVFIGVSLYSINDMGKVTRIHYHGDPYKDCPDCHGTGLVNKGDPYFECECPCKMRFY